MGPNRNFNLAIERAKLRGSAKVAFSVADSEIRWAELVLSRTVLTRTLSVQNGQHVPNRPSRNWGRFGLWGRFGSFHFTVWFPYDRPDLPGRPSRLKPCSDDRDDHMEIRLYA